MRRKRYTRKKIKLSPGMMLLVLGVALIASVFHGTSDRGPAPGAGSVVTDSASGQREDASKSALAPTSQPPTVLRGGTSVSDGPSIVAKRFVKGRKVALRDGPGKTFGILDRYDIGRELEVSEEQGDWSQVRDVLTRREGWIATALLSAETPSPQAPKKENPKSEGSGSDNGSAPSVPSLPQIPNSVVVQRIIAESIAMYPGSCACPYNTDRAGRRCGKRSAYNRGGGYAPVCFAGDVSSEMVEAFRQHSNR